MLVKCRGGQVRGTGYEGIGGLNNVAIPLVNLDGETKDGISVLKLKDLSKITCPKKGAS